MVRSQSIRWATLLGLTAVFLTLLVLTIRPVYSAGIVVNSAADTVAIDGACTLREAITNANADNQSGSTDCAAGSGPDTISFAADYTITLSGSQLPIVTTAIAITGNGAANTIIQASTCDPVNLPGNCTPATDRVLMITNPGDLTLDGVTIRHGKCTNTCTFDPTSGGGILNNIANLEVSNSVITLNRATYGGGIMNAVGNNTITDSSVSFNLADSGGGGIYNAAPGKVLTLTRITMDANEAATNSGGGINSSGGTINVTDSYLFDNEAASGGGGIYLFGSEQVSITGSTLAGNSTPILGGGAIVAQAPLQIANSTFSGNSSGVVGGAIVSISTITVAVKNTTFAGNNATAGGALAVLTGSPTYAVNNSLFVKGSSGSNCSAVPSLNATNMADDATCGAPTQKTTAEINLSPTLADNGGPTLTRALLSGSAAIDFDLATSCTAAPINNVDQRGLPRNVDIPVTGNDAGANLCDVGAYEVQNPMAILTITKETDPAGGTNFPFTIEPEERFAFKWGQYGDGNGEFNYPFGVALSPAGNVYVADAYNNRIQYFDSSGAYLAQWGGSGSGNGEFSLPFSVAVDASGNVYVTDTNNRRIQKFDSSGAYLTQWGGPGAGNGQFNLPYGIAVDSGGNVYVADTYNNRIQKFDSSGVYLDQWGTLGIGDGQFDTPFGIAVDAADNVYVSDRYNDRIQKFDSSGVYLSQFGTTGTGNGQLEDPQGVTVDAAGNIYVVDTANNRIQKFDSSGMFLTRWGANGGDGSSGSGDGEFYNPTGIAVDATGTVYVVDYGNDRIQVFKPDYAATLDDGQSESFNLAPDGYIVSELVPDGWTLDDIDCDGGDPEYDATTASVTLADGDDVTCTFSNGADVAASYCPVDPAVGYAMTDLIGTGQGNKTKGYRTRKLVIPNYQDMEALYGQLAAVDIGVMKYVRFLPQGDPKIQIAAPTSPAYRPYVVDWWGTDLPTDVQWVKGQFFWGAKANKAPRAFVLWPTYSTDEQYANVFVTFDESNENHVAWEPGFIPLQAQVIAIPETQADGATVVVRVAIVDNDKDTRPIWLSVTVDAQAQGNTDTVPNMKDSLNLYEFTFEDVPAGVSAVTIRLESPVPGELALLGGDSAAMIGAAVNYACAIEPQP